MPYRKRQSSFAIPDTPIDRQTVNNDAGNYVIVDVPPGRDAVTITKAGLGAFHVNEPTLQVNQTATLNASLSVGTVEGWVQSLEQKAVVDSPLNGRNFTQLLILTTGAAPIGASQQSNGFGNTAIGTSYSFPAFNGPGQGQDATWPIPGIR